MKNKTVPAAAIFLITALNAGSVYASEPADSINSLIDQRVEEIIQMTQSELESVYKRIYELLNNVKLSSVFIDLHEDSSKTENNNSTVTEDDNKEDNIYNNSDIADEILNITNEIRKSYGLDPLIQDNDLASAALSHAADMYNNNYFSHTSLDGRTFDERVRAYTGSTYSFLGENIACGNMSGEDAMELWMNSEGHRENILNSSYTHIGIACYNNYFVVDFAG